MESACVPDVTIIAQDAITDAVLLIISISLIQRYRKDGSVSALFMFLYLITLGIARMCWLFLNGIINSPMPYLANLGFALTFISFGFSILFISRSKTAMGLFLLVLSMSVLSFSMFPAEYRAYLNGNYWYFIPQQAENILLIPTMLGFLPPAYLLIYALKAIRLNLRMSALKPVLIALGLVLILLGEAVFLFIRKGTYSHRRPARNDDFWGHMHIRRFFFKI